MSVHVRSKVLPHLAVCCWVHSVVRSTLDNIMTAPHELFSTYAVPRLVLNSIDTSSVLQLCERSKDRFMRPGQ